MGFLSGLLSPVLSAVGTSVGGPVGGAIGGILGTALGGGGGSSKAAVTAADPFASQRGQYQQQLSQLMSGNFTPSDPSYKFRLDQGMDTVNRGAAASGLLRSGNRLAELMSYGQGLASTEYNNQFNRLAQLSGAQIGSPATAAQMLQSNAAGASALGGQFGSQIGNWLTGALGGGGGSVGAGFMGGMDILGAGEAAGGVEGMLGEGALMLA